ncbi:MAG: methyl-accepting chemotaxis protein [Helicobacteraceae bacterium]|nr:methyl-accepting chemotaxis protein [Helicobacteraceae bacterium]
MLVKHKLLIVLILSVVSLIAVGGIGIQIAFSNLATMDNMRSVRLKKVIHIMEFEKRVIDLTRRSYQVASLSRLPYREQLEELRTINALLGKLIESADNALVDYVTVEPVSEYLKGDWGVLGDSFKKWSAQDRDVVRQIDSALRQPSEAALQAIYGEVTEGNLARRNTTQAIMELTGKFVKANEEITNNVVAAAESRNSSAIVFLGVLTLAIIVVVVVFVYSLYSSVVKPIGRARDTLVQVATDQDLKLRVNYKSKDEIGEMVAAFDRMMEKIQRSVVTVQEKVDLVNKEVTSFSQVAESVAQGSQAQSSATSSMAASVEQMSVSISSVAGNANDAQKLARNAGEVSEQGRQVIEKTAGEMSATVEVVTQTSGVIQALGEESRQISAVVQVIKDVADQTNLLALNAAIEAARAGDQGRGFAVVADEVRKLAERTAKSVDDITAMISKIQASANEAVEVMDKVVRQVEQGKNLTREAGDKMQTIKNSANKVSDAIDEISNALKEQSLASQDIAKNVENIAQMTDRNNESASNASDGVKKVRALSDEVNATLAQFKA